MTFCFFFSLSASLSFTVISPPRLETLPIDFFLATGMSVYCTSCSHHEDSPIDAGDAGNVVLTADALGQESVADFPREHGRVLPLVPGDHVDHLRRGDLRLAAADDARLVAPRLVEPDD